MSTTTRRRAWFLIVAVVIVCGVLLVGLLGAALMAVGGWTNEACPGTRPPLTGTVPQLAIVGALIASFLAGGLTSAWPVGTSYPEHQSHVRSALDQRRVRQTMRLAFALLFFLLTFLLSLEAATLYLKVWPITYYVWCANYVGTYLTALGGGIYTFLAGRWLWNWRDPQ